MAAEEIVEPGAVGGRPAGAGRRLARDAVGSFALNVVNVAATLLTTVLLARIMGVTEFGTFSFVIATVTLLGIPAILGVDRLLTRDIAVHVSRSAFGLARGLLRRAQQFVLATSLTLALVAAVVAWVVTVGEISASLAAFLLGLAALPFLAIGRVVQGALMGLHHILLGQSAEYVLRPMILLGLVIVFAALGATVDAPVAVLFQGLSLAIACLVSVLLLRSRTPAAIRASEPLYATRQWISTAASLGLLTGATLMNSQIGVALLGVLSGPDSSGLYAVAQRGALLIAFPLSALNTAIAPTTARLWSSGENQRLQRLVTLSARRILLTALPFVLGYVLFGRAILVTLFGPDFAGAEIALSILAFGQLANVATGPVTTLLVMTGHERKAALGIAAGAVVNVIGCAALIPGLGVAGAAVAAAVALAVSNIVLVVVAQRQLGIYSTALGSMSWLPRRTG